MTSKVQLGGQIDFSLSSLYLLISLLKINSTSTPMDGVSPLSNPRYEISLLKAIGGQYLILFRRNGGIVSLYFVPSRPQHHVRIRLRMSKTHPIYMFAEKNSESYFSTHLAHSALTTIMIFSPSRSKFGSCCRI
jgi:hypothetical protein